MSLYMHIILSSGSLTCVHKSVGSHSKAVGVKSKNISIISILKIISIVLDY